MHLSLRSEMLISVVLLYMNNVTFALSYKELEDLGVSCPPRDSCRNRTNKDRGNKPTCECHPTCSEKGTCCIDSPYRDVIPHGTPQKCIPINERPVQCRYSHGVWTVIKCNPRWKGPSFLKDLCEGDASKLGNFLMLVPAYNPVSRITYTNYFCAMCNSDDKDAVVWDVNIESYQGRSFLEPCQERTSVDLEYNDSTRNWGYRNHFAQGKSMFIPVSFHVQPTGINDNVCRTRIVWGCVPSWEDEEVRKKCEAYMATLQHSWKTFRNVHCAICNHVSNFEDFLCEQYYDSSFWGVCGVATFGVDVITSLFGLNKTFKRCREMNETYYNVFGGCRPTVSRTGER